MPRTPGARRLRVYERLGIPKDAQWTPVPVAMRQVVRDRRLGLAAYAVLIEIVDVYHPAFGGLVPFSASAVGKRLAVDRRHVSRALDELVAAGLVVVERPVGGHMVLHVEGFLLALRLAAVGPHLPLLRFEAGDVRAEAVDNTVTPRDSSPGGVGLRSQGGGTRHPPAGSTELTRGIQSSRADEPAHVREILAQLNSARKAAQS